MLKNMLSRCVFIIFSIFTLVTIWLPVEAATLKDAYYQALKHDSKVLEAYQELMATKAKTKQAHGLLLPKIDLNAIYVTGSGTVSGVIPRVQVVHQSQNLTVKQPVFNLANMNTATAATQSLRMAYVNYTVAKNDLLKRVTKNYFDVLMSVEVLDEAKENKKLVGLALAQANRSYELKMETQDQVFSAKASYNNSLAAVTSAKGYVSKTLLLMRNITGKTFYALSPLLKDRRLFNKKPSKLAHLLKQAQLYNLQVILARMNVDFIHRKYWAVEGSRFPVVNAFGAFTNSRDEGLLFAGSAVLPINIDENIKTTSRVVGITANLPIYTGGIAGARSNQFQHQYYKAVLQRTQAQRDIALKTHLDYIDIRTDLKKIKAGDSATKAARSAVVVSQQMVGLGNQLTINLLQEEEKLFSTKKRNIQNHYNYINHLLALQIDKGATAEISLSKIMQYLDTKQVVRIQKRDLIQ